MVKYRHEWKHEISYADMLVLRHRLAAIMKWDDHTENGTYEISSLYFDNASDKALREKTDGVNMREKFRIRYYNNDLSFIKLEKKCKENNLCRKSSTRITKEQTQAILQGNYAWMRECEDPLVQELYSKMTTQQLRPKTIVVYTREPFVYGPGNVRITLDYHIRTGLQSIGFLNPACVTVPAGDAPIILEVKWDEYLPDIIRDIVQLDHCRVGAFSKYAACRIYG